MENKNLSASPIWAELEDMKGGKFLVLRRDNTVFPGPYFVLGPRDPAAEIAMIAYAREARRLGYDSTYVDSCYRHADRMARYRGENGEGDPDRGPHRQDDPCVIARIEEGA